MLDKDLKSWATNELHQMLEKIINAKQHKRKPYFLIITMKQGYHGPPVRNNNELLNTQAGQQEIDLSGKRVMTQRILISDEQPKVPLIGSSCWRIDNKIGEAKCLYILPPDRPIIWGNDKIKFVFESKQKTKSPYVYQPN